MEQEVAADLGTADALGGLGNALALHALLFELKIPDEAAAGEDEERTGLPRKRARPVPALGLLDRLVPVAALVGGTVAVIGRTRSRGGET